MTNVEGRRKRRPKPTEGDIFAVPLGDGAFAFGQVSRGLDHAYFDIRSDLIPRLEEIVAHRVIFRVPVTESAIEEGGWRVLGNLPLRDGLAEFASYRNQPIGSNQLYLYHAGKFTPANYEEVKDLEALAGWSGKHILERLQDHFSGRPNSTLDFFQKIKAYDPTTGQEIGTR